MSISILDNISLADASEEHLHSIVLLKVAEGQRLEFKRAVELNTDGQKKELCKDLCGFANTVGGDLIVGIDQDSDGRATALVGHSTAPGGEERIRQVIASGIQPHLQNFDLRQIQLANGNQATVIRVGPDGLLHQVKYGDNRYYKRLGIITDVMDPADIQTFHRPSNGTTREEQMRKERGDFEAAVKGGQFYGLPCKSGVVALSIIPQNPTILPIFAKGRSLITAVPPVYSMGWDMQYHPHSITTFRAASGEQAPDSVTEIRESGSIFAAERFLLATDRRTPLARGLVPRFIPSIAYEREIIASMHKYLLALLDLDASPPWYAGVSLLNVRGYTMYVDPIRQDASRSRVWNEDDVVANPVAISSRTNLAAPADVARLLKPAFDQIWRAFGYPYSFNFSDDGNWIGE